MKKFIQWLIGFFAKSMLATRRACSLFLINGLNKKYLIVCNRWLKTSNDKIVIRQRFYQYKIFGWLFPEYHLSYLYSDCFLMNGIQAGYYYLYLKIFAWFSKYNLRIVKVDSVLNRESYGYKYLHKKAHLLKTNCG